VRSWTSSVSGRDDIRPLGASNRLTP